MKLSEETLEIVWKVHNNEETTLKERLRLEAEIVRLLRHGGVSSLDAVNLVLAYAWAPEREVR